MIRFLVAKNVAITSTCQSLKRCTVEPNGIGAASALLNPRVLAVMSTDARVAISKLALAYLLGDHVALLRKAMDLNALSFKRADSHRRSDPTGNGGTLQALAITGS